MSLSSTELPLRCTCGKVRGVLDRGASLRAQRVVCYCADCQRFARFLERADVMDAAGGTDILQTAISRVRITEGTTELGCMRLSDKGLYRWFSTCCRTPIGNTIGPRFPFIGLILAFLDHEKEQRSRDDLFGKPLAYIHGREGIPPVPAHVHPKAPPSVILRLLPKLLGWWISGRNQPSELFDRAARAPRVTPRVLTKEERAALR